MPEGNCEDPEIVPEGSPATICADDDTVPDGTLPDPLPINFQPEFKL